MVTLAQRETNSVIMNAFFCICIFPRVSLTKWWVIVSQMIRFIYSVCSSFIFKGNAYSIAMTLVFVFHVWACFIQIRANSILRSHTRSTIHIQWIQIVFQVTKNETMNLIWNQSPVIFTVHLMRYISLCVQILEHLLHRFYNRIKLISKLIRIRSHLYI